MDKDDEKWYFGAIFFNKHYMVFDMTSYTERDHDWLQVGIGIKNPINIIGETLYDKDSKYYDSTPKVSAEDVSVQYNGGADIKNDARCVGCDHVKP